MENRVCKRCLMREMEGNEQEKLQKYLSIIRQEERTPEAEYEKRLQICKTCELLLEATCQACGCYVEFRAAVKGGRCPKKKWQ